MARRFGAFGVGISILMAETSLGVLRCPPSPKHSLSGKEVQAPPAEVQTQPNLEEGKKPPPPDWLHEACWYEINVPHFRNGEPDNDPPGTLSWPANWPPDQGPATNQFQADRKLREAQFGGDLQGLKSKFGYIKDLGINTLCLSGVFPFKGEELTRREGPGRPHFVLDLRHIDESVSAKQTPEETSDETFDATTWRFTMGDRLFLDFVREAHKSGIRVVITQYLALSTSGEIRPEVVEFLFATTKRWMDPDGDGDPSDGIDGWRIFPESVPIDFAKRWAAHIKKINAKAVIAGAGHPGLKDTDLSYLDIQSKWDVSELIQGFFRWEDKFVPLHEFLDCITKHVEDHGPVSATGHMTYVPRVLAALIRNEAWRGLSERPSRKTNEDDLGRARLVIFLQHFLPGSPLTSAGDEVGMDNYAPMWWTDLLNPESKPDDYRPDFAELIRWVHSRRAVDAPMREGGFRIVMVDEDRKLFAIGRPLGNDETILLVNYGAEKQEVVLPAGKPGQMIGVLIPSVQPTASPKAKPGENATPAPEKSVTFQVNDGRQLVDELGEIRLWVSPMSVGVILVREGELR